MITRGETWLLGVVCLSFLFGGMAAAKEDGATLEKAHAPGSLYVATDNGGRVAVWEWQRGWVLTWAQDGAPGAGCHLHDIRLGVEPVRLALRGNTALLRFSDQAMEGQNKERGLLVDLDRCEIIREINFDGTGLGMESSEDGWLLVLNPALLHAERATPGPFVLRPEEYSLVEIDDDGKVSRTFDVAAPQRELTRELKLDDLLGPMNGRLVAARDEVWFIPNVVYELWRVPQRGLPLRRVRPPECLAARGRRVTGEENVNLYREMSKDQPESVRKQWMQGRINDSFRAAVTSAVTFNRLLALTVRDKLLGSERVDVWDMRTELLVAMTPLPQGTRLVALGEDHAWLLRDGKDFERLNLPDLLMPLQDPCKMYADLITEREKAKPAPPESDGTSAPVDGPPKAPTLSASPALGSGH